MSSANLDIRGLFFWHTTSCQKPTRLCVLQLFCVQVTEKDEHFIECLFTYTNLVTIQSGLKISNVTQN